MSDKEKAREALEEMKLAAWNAGVTYGQLTKLTGIIEKGIKSNKPEGEDK